MICRGRRSVSVIQGVKEREEKGVWVTPAFPKLIYVLEGRTFTRIRPTGTSRSSPLECTIVRMVPDYISEKDHAGD